MNSFLLEFWPLFAAAFAAGLVDSMGGGGGLITVPTLLALGLPLQITYANLDLHKLW